MKTEKEIEQKYNEMIQERGELYAIVDESPAGMPFDAIRDVIDLYYQQCGMIDVIEWVLDKN